MLPLTATSSRRPCSIDGESVLIKGFLIHEMQVWGGEIRAMDGEGPQKMPVGKPVERRRVVVLVQTPRQLCNHCVIEARKTLLGDRWITSTCRSV